MKNPIESLLERDERRWKDYGIKDWEYRRAQGKTAFVLKFALLWSSMTFAGFTLIEQLLDGKIKIETVGFDILFFLVFGLAFGLGTWRASERKYQKYLQEKVEK